MKKFLYVFFIFLMMCHCKPSNVINEPEGQLIYITIAAPSLQNNIFDNITEQMVAVYLPPSYDSSDNRYPVIYFLHGFSTYFDRFLNGTFQGLRFDQLMDNLINEGTIPEMILVIPNGRTFMLGSFYVNSPLRGNWEDYIVKDVVNHIDSNYRTMADNSSRGISGHSMGGFGAIHLAMKHPDIFGATYALSPGLFDSNGLSTMFMFDNQETIKTYLEKEEEFNSMSYEDGMSYFKDYITSNISDTHLIFSYAYGAAFSPNPEKKAPFIDYPYYKTGDGITLNEKNWEKFEDGFGGLEWKVKKYKANLLNLLGIRIEYGINDNYSWIPQGCKYFSQLLDNEGIFNELVEFNGGHSDRLRVQIKSSMLPFFSRLLTF